MRRAHYVVSLAVLLLTAVKSLDAQQVSLPAGTALRVALDRHVRIHKGAIVTGHLTQPVYLSDHEVLPIGSLVTGIIEGRIRGRKPSTFAGYWPQTSRLLARRTLSSTN